MCRILNKFLIVALIAALFLVQGSEGAAALSKGIPDNDTTATYSGISPPKYNVELGYIINGSEENPAPCDNPASDASCMTTLQASEDSVLIRYAVKPGYSVNKTSTIRIQMCYGPDNIIDRPWRKFDNVISENKQCGFDLVTNLSPEGEYTYLVTENAPSSVYFIQVLEVCDDGTYCSFGNSTYFNVNQIEDTPSWLMGITGALAALGPLSLIGFFLVEHKMKKN
ncbi:High-affinity nitrate transporter-activating protein 2.1 [Picochlorum sp. SENEW3]|nr:High-affinity nitrate transporter-activating protein 2.1 [Picochlorum sp. SENEW3]